jgi:hypothetical protein
MTEIDNYFRDIFASHDVQLTADDGWLTTSGSYPRCRSHVSESRQYESQCSIRLDIEVALNDQQTIIESFGDWGATPSDALASACHNFTTSSLHVFLSAIWDKHDDEQVWRETWEIEGKRWNVYLGNIVRKAAGGLDVPVPQQLVPIIEQMIRSLCLASQSHWVRVYFANMAADNQNVEVLLDNEPWEQAQDAVRNVKWPVMDSFYSSRMFLMIVPS